MFPPNQWTVILVSSASMTPTKGIALLLLLCVTAAAVAAEPKPCCAPKQWVIAIEEVQVNAENGKVTNTIVRSRKAYDATNKLVSEIVATYNRETGEAEETKTIELYPQGAKYVIRKGVCTKEALGHDFAEICVPGGAEYYETVKIGLGEYVVDGFKLTLPMEGHNYEVRFRFGREKCIPFQFTIGKIKSGKSQTGLAVKSPLPWLLSSDGQTSERVATSAQYGDYEEGIKDPDFWFKLPPECKKADDKQQIVAKKMADKLRNLFGLDKKFSVY